MRTLACIGTAERQRANVGADVDVTVIDATKLVASAVVGKLTAVVDKPTLMGNVRVDRDRAGARADYDPSSPRLPVPWQTALRLPG